MRFSLRGLIAVVSLAACVVPWLISASRQASLRALLREKRAVSWTSSDLDRYASNPYEFIDKHDNPEGFVSRLPGNLLYPVVHVEKCQCTRDLSILRSALSAPELRSVTLKGTQFDKRQLSEIANSFPYVYFSGRNGNEQIEFNANLSHQFQRHIEY